MTKLKAFCSTLLILLRPIVGLLMGWLVLFELLRLILVIASWSHHGDATLPLILRSFLVGLRFDLSMAAKIIVVFAVWRLWRPIPRPAEGKAVFAFFGLISFLSIFALAVEVEFYKEFQMRLGPLAFDYFSTDSEHNAIIGGMIWHGYPVVRWVLACVLICALFLWINRKFFTASIISQAPIVPRLFATVLWVFITVIASRGGFQSSVLRWGDAVFSQNTYANQMSENGIFMLVDTLRHPASKHKLADGWKRSLSVAQAVEETRKVTLLPGDELVDPARYPLLRTSVPTSFPVSRPKNVVLVIMESFTARFCGATGAGFGATPNYDALAKEGILFDHAFSVSTHTAQGVFGTLCSLPNLPDYDSLMKQPLGQQPFRSLPAIFSEAGHETLFLYNGLFSWDNKEGFFRNQGMKRFIGRNDYKDPSFVDPDWGVSDHDVFNRALEEFSKFEDDKKAFLGIILTLSNHAPFNLPKIKDLSPVTGGGEQNQRLNGVHYADWALGEFMRAARKSKWFDDTLFVFVGDHGFGVPPSLTEVGLLHMHVPLLFFGPKVFGERHEVRHVVASQLDILPSILGISGITLPHHSFGRDLFSLPPTDPGHAYVKRSGDPFVGFIEGNKIFVGESGTPVSLNTFDLSFPPSASRQEGGNPREMKARLNAFVVAGLQVVEKRLAAPPKPKAVVQALKN